MDDFPPARLYKYCPSDRRDFFQTRRLRFSQPGALNDPFELRPHISAYGTPEEEYEIAARHWEAGVRRFYDEKVQELGQLMTFETYRAKVEQFRERDIAERIQAHHDDPKAKAEMAQRVNQLVQGIGVLSLCEAPDDLLMWAHYAESHKGFVIEFDTASPFFHQTHPPDHVTFTEEDAASFREEYGRLRRVTYQQQRPSMVATRASFDILLVKGNSWSYEAEWRMLMPPEYAHVKLGPCGAGLPVCLFEFPFQAVTRVLLGVNASQDLVDAALRLRETDLSKHIGIERAQIDERHYQIRFKPM